MKTAKFAPLQVLFIPATLLLSISPALADPIPPPNDIGLDISITQPPQIGSAYHSVSQAFSRACVRGTGGTVALNQQGSMAARIASSTEDALSSLGIQAGGRYSTGLTNISASAEFARSTVQSGFTVNLMYKFASTYSEQFDDSGTNAVTTKDNYKSLLGNPRNFYVACGDEYVSAILRSAQILVNLSVQFASREEAQAFSAAFKYEAPMVGISTAIQNASRNVSTNTKMAFNSVQIGGNSGKSGKAVCPSDILGTATPDPNCSESMVQCGFGKFEKCIELFEKLVNYSAGDFSDQITDRTTGKPQNYVISAVHVEPYIYAGSEFPSPPEQTTERAFQVELDILNGYFNQYVRQWIQVGRIISNQTPRLSARQLGKMNQVELMLHDIVNGLTTRIEDCYDNGYEACRKNSGPGLADFLNQRHAEMKTVFGSDLDSTVGEQLDINGIEGSIANLTMPETFAQFCDLADELHPAYRTTVSSLKQVINAQAKEHSGGIDDSLLKGDVCQNYSNRLNALTELDLSKLYDGQVIRIASLDPLASLTGLKSLNLSGKGIQDVTALKRLENLTVLILDNNVISDVCVLAQLPRLQTLSIQNQSNQLTSIDCLKTSQSLAAIDARGNSSTLTCPLKTESACKVREFSQSITAFKRADSCNFHVGSQASTISGGRILVSGGLTPSNGFDLIDSLAVYNRNGCTSMPKKLQYPRANHTSTVLPDGTVLIAGGYTNTLEVVSTRPVLISREIQAHMDSPRSFHTATLLPDGRVLIVGGYTRGLVPNQRATDQSSTYEVFNPRTEKFELTGKLHYPRAEHSATLLADGRVLILGGYLEDQSLASAELIDPSRTTTEILPNMHQGRFGHSVQPLPDGRLLIAGGYKWVPVNNSDGDSGWAPTGLNSLEVYDPQAQSFTLLSDVLTVGRGTMTSQVLEDGRILLIGGNTSGRLYDLSVSRTPSTAPNYEALLASQRAIEIFDPLSMGIYSTTGLNLPRSQIAFAALDAHTYLAIGGMGSNESPVSSELLIYNPGN